TKASDAFVYLPPDLALELKVFVQAEPGEPLDFLFHPHKSRTGNLERPLNSNNYRERVLQPAAIRAGVGLYQRKNKKGETLAATDVDFRALRRTCATLFGDISKDPKSTQRQLRHANPAVTLRYYQKAVPESVKAAARAFEQALLDKPEPKRAEEEETGPIQ
ncbi:MAG TPA: hypothetical protein VKB88_44835, partial [Bryobacteraceae bacterium]|nr:hypothetical protein [Bryobacteraceae bacterium]